MLIAYYPAWDRILVFQDRAEGMDFFSLSLSQEALTCKWHMSYFTEFTKYDIQRRPL